jgi:hypothetical protein
MMKRVAIISNWKASGSRYAHPAAVYGSKITFFGLVLVLALSAVPAHGAALTLSSDLAHWAANGGWESTWSVVDTANQSLTCTLTINGPDGTALSLVTSAGTGSSISFTVPQGGSAQIQAGGAGGSVQSGSSTVSCSDIFLADVTYAYVPGGFPVTAVSVLPSGQFNNFVFAANDFTGIAMYNPNSNAAVAMVSASDSTGKQVGTAMATVPAGGKNTANLNQLITNLSNSFEGTVTITVNNGIELVALDVLPGANGSFALANVPVVAFNTQPASLSGTYSFLSGNLAGQTGTFTVNALSPAGTLGGSAEFLATATSGSITETVAVTEMNNGTMLVHFFNSSGFLSGAVAALTSTSTGFSGSFYLPGATSGSIGSMSLTFAQ